MAIENGMGAPRPSAGTVPPPGSSRVRFTTERRERPPGDAAAAQRFTENPPGQRSAISRDHLTRQKFWTWAKLARYGVYTAWAVILMVVFGQGWAFPDGSNPSCSEEDPARNKSMCGVIDTFASGSRSLAFLAGFVLAGFLLSSRALWLARRTAYCALCGATRNLLINVTTLPPAEDRPLLARWALLGYELSVLKARMLVDTDEARAFLETSRLIDGGDEWESMVNGDRHTTVWYWIQSKAKKLHDEGSINPFELLLLCQAVTLSRDKANDLMSCIDRDQPPPYVFVCALLININLFFYSTVAGIEWSVWMNDAGGLPVFGEPRLYCGIIILYLYTTIYAMLFDVCSMLYNPFGPREFDVPHSMVSKGVRLLGVSLSESSGGCEPLTMEAEMGNFFEWLKQSPAEMMSQRRLSDLSDIGVDSRISLFPQGGFGLNRRGSVLNEK